MMIVNKRTVPIYYSIYELTTSHSIGQGTLEPNTTAGFHVDYTPTNGQSLLRCAVYVSDVPSSTYSPMKEHFDVPADAVVTIATEIRSGVLGNLDQD